MNTKGVEDGITARVWIDPRTEEPCRRCDGTGKMPPWPGSKGLVACGVCQETQTAAVPVANLDELLLNVRSATPEELTAQAESYGKNYKPGPRQAVPFMPSAAVPVEERTRVNHIWSGKEKMACGCSAKTEYPYYNAETGHIHCIACGTAYSHQSQTDAVVPERTAEMEREVWVEHREYIASKVRKHYDESPQEIASFICFMKAPAKSDIEGKAKAVSQEVKE